ncbi:uncharacterized protein EV422DRAFT_418584 [Fimicolochytrium jonesii]|uniref:uncharacterized protein n=1 Tax=Fimicolochytrium jonesii TaxID=1396493 RepID=UPI0022FDBFC8|nr:uncharacterized protein EV422DRAFT_418584 [Fimicolochytrium jonesii]KAI8822147.1 hypothetical protein EV422DRAFT_418584 [Fimicolochytrium jonesii]
MFSTVARRSRLVSLKHSGQAHPTGGCPTLRASLCPLQRHFSRTVAAADVRQPDAEAKLPLSEALWEAADTVESKGKAKRRPAGASADAYEGRSADGTRRKGNRRNPAGASRGPIFPRRGVTEVEDLRPRDINSLRLALHSHDGIHAWRCFLHLEAQRQLEPLTMEDYNNLLRVVRARPNFGKVSENRARKTINNMDHIVKTMTEHGLSPNAATYATLVTAHANAGDVEGVQQISDIVAEKGWVLENEKAAMLLARAKVSPKEALEDFGLYLLKYRHDGRGVPIYNMLLQQFSELGDDESFHQTLRLAKEFLLVPNSATYDILIQHFAIRGDLNEAKGILEQRNRQGLPKSVNSYTGLMKGYDKARDYQGVLDLFRELEASNIPLLISTYNFVMRAMLNVSDYRGAMVMFLRLKRNQRLSPNTMTFGVLGDLILKWPNTFRDLVIQARGQASPQLYKWVIKGVLQADRRRAVAKLCEEFRDLNRVQPFNFVLTDWLLNAELEVNCIVGQRALAERLWNEYFKANPSPVAKAKACYSMLVLYGHPEVRDYVKAREMFEEHRSTGIPVTLVTYDRLLRSVWRFEEKLTERAIALVREVVDSGLVRIPSSMAPESLCRKAMEAIGHGDVSHGFQLLAWGKPIDYDAIPLWTDLYPEGKREATPEKEWNELDIYA